MNSPAPVLDRASNFVLRVYGGRLDGAQFRLPPGRLLTLGHGLDNDIVLRGARTRGSRIELQAEEGHLRLKLLTGEAHLLGQTLEPHKAIVLPAFVPLMLGEYSFAVGAADHPRWGEAEELAGQLVPLEPAAVPVTGEPLAAQERARNRAYSLTRYLPAWAKHPAAMIVPAMGLAMLLALAPLHDFATRGLRGPEQAEAALLANGYPGVKVALDPTGGFLVFSGAVASEDDLARLREMAAAEFPQARLDVDTNAALARAATDILAAEGIDAQARPERLGTVVIESEYLPLDRQAELTERLTADLPALQRARFELTGRRGASDLAYFFNSEKYGLATYVNGNPGYLVTADGSHWFDGAILPTGHEILSIRNGSVTLSRNGLVERLTVDPGARSPIVPSPGGIEPDPARPALPVTPQPALPQPSNTGERT